MQIFSRNKYLYYTFYLFYCQSRISFLCNLSRNICEILRFFRRKFQKSVLFFSFITKSPGKWGFLLKNVCKKLENGEQKGAPYKRNAFVLTRDSIHIFQHLSNTFFVFCKKFCCKRKTTAHAVVFSFSRCSDKIRPPSAKTVPSHMIGVMVSCRINAELTIVITGVA